MKKTVLNIIFFYFKKNWYRTINVNKYLLYKKLILIFINLVIKLLTLIN